ncbi:hypothetical protein ACHAWO_000094 [Cyclotella atomus]|uniref:Uncharacterized protein n=1 Tax=Cyclotella atomus TaxID=382360 RepID=A0ABD3NW18_9STRA
MYDRKLERKRSMNNRTVALVLFSFLGLSDAFTQHMPPRQRCSLYNKVQVNTVDLQISSQHKIMANTPERACRALMMTKNEDNEEVDEEIKAMSFSSKVDSFLDAMLEIPDTRLFAGDILFLLIVNFLLQIGSEVGDPNFWASGGFSQPVTMPKTLSALVVRDSKMTMSWILAGLWNRAYSTSSVSDDNTAIKKAIDVWVDYFSLRIVLELVGSILFTHTLVDVWPLAQEVWYTLIVMAFYRLSYGRFLSNFF